MVLASTVPKWLNGMINGCQTWLRRVWLHDEVEVESVAEGKVRVSGRVTDELLVEHVLQQPHRCLHLGNVLHAVHYPDDSFVS
jgi:hypothetical protein